MKFTKRLVFSTLSLSLLMSGPLMAGDQDFDLMNKTGYTISEVYVSPSKANEWGEDVLGKREMHDGTKLSMHFPNEAKHCKWDLKVVYDDGTPAEWNDFDLCTVSKITIHWNKDTQETTAEYE